MVSNNYGLLGIDLSAIESRVRSWVARDEGLLEEYRGEGKVYEATAAGIYGISKDDVTKEQRLSAKIAELALGFKGSYRALQRMARQFGFEMSDEVSMAITAKWRDSRKPVVDLWTNLEQTARKAIRFRGTVCEVPGTGCPIHMVVRNGSLRIRLPSGRIIYYQRVGLYRNKIIFDTYRTGPAYRDNTHGGKLTENVVQAIALDILNWLLLSTQDRIDAENLSDAIAIMLHCHDEECIELDVIYRAKVAAWLDEILENECPAWTAGLPIRGKQWTDERYAK